MAVDIKLGDFYEHYIQSAKEQIEDYNIKKEELISLRENVKDYIIKNADFFKDNYKLDIYKYDIEINQGRPNPSNALYGLVTRLKNNESNLEKQSKLLQIIKYCNILNNIEEYDKLISKAEQRFNITKTKYNEIIKKYYYNVQKQVLNGLGYKFSNGIGIYSINRWKLDKEIARKKIDYKATKANKERLLAEGKRLYNKEEAEWYKANNIPYDGVEYVVYLDKDYIYEITISNSAIMSNRTMNFKKIEYVNAKYKGYTFEQLADMCDNVNDIFNFPVDIRFKLNMLLYKKPEHYIHYIRNENQDHNEYRANRC